MRLLVVIAHYYRHAPASERRSFGSDRMPFAKITGLNAAIVALHRHCGTYRLSLEPPVRRGLDIVVVTAPGDNLLEWLGLDPSSYAVEYYDGEPLLLPFEAQRIMRERAGAYDLYAYLEDDLIVDDPAFFEKIAWFAATFGPRALLSPRRYEMPHAGSPEKQAIDHPLGPGALKPFRKAGSAPVLAGEWNGRRQAFRLPTNPHSGCFVVDGAQLRLWIESGTLYDRDASWISPLESAATLAPGKVFTLYRAAEPDPWFVAIEHFGAHYATLGAAAGETYGEPPLLAWVEAAARQGFEGVPEALAAMAAAATTDNMLRAEATKHRMRADSLERSRGQLARALVRAIWRKAAPRSWRRDRPGP
ncbi:MAG TPA: hypothetical protein VGG29_19195 [Caulobacteraceae bacterium]|jgi:hypothetical protein